MSMKVEYINPFIESTYDLFSTMLSSTAKRGNVGVVTEEFGQTDVTALIGLSGYAKGMVAMSFPKKTALNMCGKLLGNEPTEVDDTVSDAVAELVNIVAGGAKAKFPRKDGEIIDLSLPTVVRGQGYKVDYPSGSVWLEVPFESDLGAFTLRVTFSFDTDT